MAAAQRWTRVIRGRRGAGAVPRMAPALLFPVLVVLLGAAVLLGVGVGAVRIAPWQTAAIVAGHLGADLDVDYTRQQDAIVWAIRLPRVLLGMAVGSALATAGAALQGMFRNPLADPALIGVSSGASLGAVAAVLAGVTSLDGAALPVAAFAGGVVAALAVYALSRHDGRTEVVTLILVGIALNAIAGAGTGILTYAGSDEEVRDVVFWSLGSLGRATWRTVGVTLPFVAVGLALVPRRGKELNLLVLGEREARHLGVDSERVRLELIVLTAVLTGAAVAVAGVIAFVGLIVPHVIRRLAGPDHRILLPASALLGATLVLLADLAARSAAAPAEIPLGVVTALLGGPFLLVVMLRTRQAHGGWG